MPIIYGGSVTEERPARFIAQYQWVFVDRASLSPESFGKIVHFAQNRCNTDGILP